MTKHLDGSKGRTLPMAAVKADAGGAHLHAPTRGGDAGITRATTADGWSITVYDNRIPAFVEAALEQRYGSLYSSLAAMRAHGSLAQASVFLATRDGEVVMLWLFHRDGNGLRVLNEAIAVTAEEAACFADHVFAAYPEVEYIVFNAVDTAIRSLPWPLRREECTDDSVLALPATMDDYLAALGKATRKNVRRYGTRLKECFPGFTCKVSLREQIDESRVREVIRLNRLRMHRKGKTPGIDDEDERIILELARQHGVLVTASIHGRICAGAILFRLRDNYFSFVRAHDPAYDDYRLGLVFACEMIAECIARGGKELHFMWGREPHKAMLLGVEKQLERLTLYRSTWHMLRNWQVVFRHAAAGVHRQAKLWLQDKMNRDDDLLARAAVGVRWLVRRLRGLRS